MRVLPSSIFGDSMVKYFVIDYIKQGTATYETKLFMVINELALNAFFLNNGLIIKGIREVEPFNWWLTSKDKKQVIFIGKEVIK